MNPIQHDLLYRHPKECPEMYMRRLGAQTGKVRQPKCNNVD